MSQQFEKDLEKTLAASAAQVDQGTRDELARRRRDTLDALEQTSPRQWLWLPATGIAAAALAALVLLQPFASRQLPDPAVADNGDMDMEILLADEGYELYEDLEFYEWMDVIGDTS